MSSAKTAAQVKYLYGMLADKLGKFLTNAKRLWPDNRALQAAHDAFESDIASVRNDPHLLSIVMDYIVEEFHKYFSMNAAQAAALCGTAVPTPSDPRSFFQRVAANDETVVVSIRHPLVADSKLGESFAALRKNPANARNADAIFAYFKQMVDAARITCDTVYGTPARDTAASPALPPQPPAPQAPSHFTADQKNALKLSIVPLAYTMEKFLKNALLLWPDSKPLQEAFDTFDATVFSVINDEALLYLPMKMVIDQFNYFFSMNEAQSEAFAAGERAVQDVLKAGKSLTAAEKEAVRTQAVRTHKPSEAALRDTRTFFARVAEGDTRVVNSIHHPLVVDSKLGQRYLSMRKDPVHSRNADAIWAHFKHMVNTANMACVSLRLPTSVVSSSLAATPSSQKSSGGGFGRRSGKKNKNARDDEAQHTAKQVAGIVEALDDDAIAATKRAVEGKSKKEIQQMHQTSMDVQKKIESEIRLAEMKKRRDARNKALGLS